MTQKPDPTPKRRKLFWPFSWFEPKSGDPHRRCSSANRTAAQDKVIARRALSENDPRHAAVHVAGAIFDDPNDREALDLADEIMRVSKDPLEYVPVEKENYAGNMALRAYFLGQAGQIGEAIQLLRQVIRLDSKKPFEFWSLRWLDRPEALSQVPPVDVAGILSTVIIRFPGHSHESNTKAMAMLRPWVNIAKKYIAHHSNDATLKAIASLVIRRTGDFATALALADESYRLEPSYMAATARATVHEARQDLTAAMVAYRDALKIDPGNAEILADMAILELRRQNFFAAMEHTRLGLKSVRNHRTLEPLEWFLQYKLHEDAAALEKLSAYADSHPGHTAHDWLSSLSPFIGMLPATAEATLNVIDQILPKLRESAGKDTMGKKVTMTLSAIEAPSAMLAVRRALAAFGMTMPVTIENIAQPDPRKSCQPIAVTLWEYDGTEARPVPPAPPQALTDRVSALAQKPYGLWDWGAKAAAEARTLAPKNLPVLLATTVHPPPCPKPEREAAWILRHQVAAALIALQVRDGPFKDSPAEDAILALLFAPMDWINIAGILALTYEAAQAQSEPVSTRIAYQLMDRLKGRPKNGACCFDYCLYWALASLPKIDPKAHEQFAAMYQDFLKQP